MCAFACATGLDAAIGGDNAPILTMGAGASLRPPCESVASYRRDGQMSPNSTTSRGEWTPSASLVVKPNRDQVRDPKAQTYDRCATRCRRGRRLHETQT